MEISNVLIVEIPNSTTINIKSWDNSTLINKLINDIEFIKEELIEVRCIIYEPNEEIIIKFYDAVECFRFLYTLTAKYDILVKGGKV